MAMSVIERSSSCLLVLDTFQLRLTFVLTAGFMKICGVVRSIFVVLLSKSQIKT